METPFWLAILEYFCNWFMELKEIWLLYFKMSAKSLSSKAGEYVCALVPSSSKANRASLTELAEAPKPYSLKIGNTPQFEKALNETRISIAAASFTFFINSRLFRRRTSSIT